MSSLRANCSLCGAPVIWALAEEGPVALDSAESISGPYRYIMEDASQVAEPWRVVRVASAAIIPAYLDHSKTCPRRG